MHLPRYSRSPGGLVRLLQFSTAGHLGEQPESGECLELGGGEEEEEEEELSQLRHCYQFRAGDKS